MPSIENQQKKIPIDISRVQQVLEQILFKLDIVEKDLTILLVDDEAIREINHQYLNRNRPTNVISFSMTEGEFGHVNPDILGDIVISVETAQRDASEGNLEFEDEVDFLIIHGILHLLGYNHESGGPEADVMKTKEKELFFELKGYRIE